MDREPRDEDTYYARHRKARLSYQRRYYWRNREAILKKEQEKKTIDEAHRDRIRVYNKDYFATHKERIYEQRKRKVPKRAAQGSKQGVKTEQGSENGVQGAGSSF